jgi:nucleoside-diphosphate-sugar epimerase
MFSSVVIADIRKSSLFDTEGVYFANVDVRQPISFSFPTEKPEWIFNLAAIHREPGHSRHEYFDTNVNGAKHVTSFAAAIACHKIFFTSTLAIYGITDPPADESRFPAPMTPYGSSKARAEQIHQEWQQAHAERKLIVTRPGVIYGPGDPGNILRMIRAVKRGYFAFPGSIKVKKSYAYIFGFMDSVIFTMNRNVPLLVYNYAETPTESIGELVQATRKKLNVRTPTISIPTFILSAVAYVMFKIRKHKSALHPLRVKKAATATHIIPKFLIDSGFFFRYTFRTSLDHWAQVAPEDFR